MASGSGASAQPANKLETIKQNLHKFLHEENSFTYPLALAERYTSLKREYIFIGLVAFLGLYLVVGYGAGLVVNLLGFVYPAYKSCKAIDSEDKDDDTQWLTYWVVYALFGITEYFTDIIMSWIPFYFLAKCAFLVWCMLPMASNGSVIIYTRLIKPFVARHEKTIDSAISAGTKFAKQAGKEATAAVTDRIGQVDMRTVMQAKETMEELTSADKPEKQD